MRPENLRIASHLSSFLSVVLLISVLAGNADNPPNRGEKAHFSESELFIGTAEAEFKADDSMVIAGGITPGKAGGQEGKLRAVAIVLHRPPFEKLAIVACDILMITREFLDDAAEQIEAATGILSGNLLINCTHTHHAPSTVLLHGYQTDPAFANHVRQKIVEAVTQANANLTAEASEFYFHLGAEKSVGQNSRQLLSDGQIYWIGPRDQFVRPTGPFDPELPVWGFRHRDRRWQAVIFNHSTHTIGTRQPGVRSPSFYGLASQELESELGGLFCFLEGASGSTHNLTLGFDDLVARIKTATRRALASAMPHKATPLKSLKRPFHFNVRSFDESKEEAAVARYCRDWVGPYGEQVIRVFRNMRNNLAPQQGQPRETWIQAMRIGDIAIVGVPAEFFTKLGLDIKNRSPFRYTYIAELANDWIGYLPDLDAHQLGGYQVWTGYHSYAEHGTGERMVEEVVKLLNEL